MGEVESSVSSPEEFANLTDQVAIVTGGSKGLGFEIACALAGAGASVVVASRTRAECLRASAEIEDMYGRPAVGHECDVASEQAVNDLVEQTIERFDRIDVLVNSAGVNVRGKAEDVSREDFDFCFAVNVTGTWLMSRACAKYMRARQYGRIINLSSAVGLIGAAGTSAYSAAKGAVVQLTRTLALEWALDGITVNAIAPGPFLTPMNEPVANAPASLAMLEHQVPLQRWGQPSEIRLPALFLASPGASYTTGAVLCVDGGRVAK